MRLDRDTEEEARYGPDRNFGSNQGYAHYGDAHDAALLRERPPGVPPDDARLRQERRDHDAAVAASLGDGRVRIGSPVPDISAVDLDGKKFNLSDYRGKVVDLSFWADWCPWCIKMFPHEKALVEKYKDRPFVLVGVNGDPTNAEGSESARRHKLPWRSIWNGGEDGPLTRSFRVQGWPASFLIDANGIVRGRVDGYNPDAVERAVERLVAEAESSNRK